MEELSDSPWMEVRQDSSMLWVLFTAFEDAHIFFSRLNLKILLSNIRLYTWDICQNRFESCSVIIKNTSLRGVFMHGLKMFRYFISFLKVTCLGNSNFWTQFIFQTPFDYLSFLFQRTCFHTHFISVNLYWIPTVCSRHCVRFWDHKNK